MNNEPVKVQMIGHIFANNEKYILLTHIFSLQNYDEVYLDERLHYFLVTNRDYKDATLEAPIFDTPFILVVSDNFHIAYDRVATIQVKSLPNLKVVEQ